MKQMEVTILGQSYLLGCPEGGERDLLEAVESVDREMSAIRDAGKVKAKDTNSSTPLLWAVQTGCSPSAIRALLKAGADPNAKAKGGATPLMFAEIYKRTEIAELLPGGAVIRPAR